MRGPVVLVLFSLAACASPTNVTLDPGTGVAKGPRDLGGFITPVEPEPDMAVAAVADMAVKPADLATVAHDMAMVAHDMATSSSGCGAVTYAGSCAGNTLTYCSSSSMLVTIDCAAAGNQCTVVSGDADCRAPATSTSCGSITSDGICSGNVLKYCDTSNHLVTQDCSATAQSCDASFGYADCY